VVLGMPYPNPADPELRERMRFMDAVAGRADAADIQSGAAVVRGSVGTGAGQMEASRGQGLAAAQTRDEPSSAGVTGSQRRSGWLFLISVGP